MTGILEPNEDHIDLGIITEENSLITSLRSIFYKTGQYLAHWKFCLKYILSIILCSKKKVKSIFFLIFQIHFSWDLLIA